MPAFQAIFSVYFRTDLDCNILDVDHIENQEFVKVTGKVVEVDTSFI